jgi:hypothetical protein
MKAKDASSSLVFYNRFAAARVRGIEYSRQRLHIDPA